MGDFRFLFANLPKKGKFHLLPQSTHMRKITVFFPFFFLILMAFSQGKKKDSCPCCTPEHRQFDFWLGDWETFKGNTDTLAGTNQIVLLQDKCIMQENWTSASGKYTGTSYNWWDGELWHQTWVDNQGGSLQLFGTWNGIAMVLESPEMISQKGKPYTNKITWTPNKDGSVRQLWEISKDEKATWTAVFDGLYKQKKGKK